MYHIYLTIYGHRFAYYLHDVNSLCEFIVLVNLLDTRADFFKVCVKLEGVMKVGVSDLQKSLVKCFKNLCSSPLKSFNIAISSLIKYM